MLVEALLVLREGLLVLREAWLLTHAQLQDPMVPTESHVRPIKTLQLQSKSINCDDSDPSRPVRMLKITREVNRL